MAESIILPNKEIVLIEQEIVEGTHLTWGEMTKGGTRVPVSNDLIVNARKLAVIFGELREAWGSPIIVTSGFRPPHVNRSVRGAKNSQHLYFRAVDCYPQNGKLTEFWQHAFNSKFTGLGDGRKKGFIHLDTRPGSRVVFNY